MYELQYSTHVHRRPVCILLRQSLWRGWRGVRREGRKGGGGGSGGLEKHHSSASLPAITSEMKCWFSFVLIFSKCGRLSANTTTLTMPWGVMCVKRGAFFFCTGKCVLKSHWTSAGWHKDEVWPFCQMLWNFERIVSEAALLCFLSAVDR